MAKELTTQSYIEHHLTNLTCGQLKDGGWSCNPYDVETVSYTHLTLPTTPYV